MDRRKLLQSIEAQKDALAEQAAQLAAAERRITFEESEGNDVSDLKEMVGHLKAIHGIAARRVKMAEDKLAEGK